MNKNIRFGAEIVGVLFALAGCAEQVSVSQPESCSMPKFVLPADPVLLIAGQSNGVSPAQGDFSSAFSTTGRVQLNDYYSYVDDVFRVPTNSAPMTGGVAWIFLGDLLPGNSTFNVIARGGTSSQQWVETHVTRLVEALSNRKYDAVLWIQGESDFGALGGDKTYSNMRFIMDKADAAQKVPWFVAIDGMRYRTVTSAAQQRLVDECRAYRGADIDVLRLEHPEYFGDGLGEFENEAGLRGHAKAWYDVLTKEN